MTVSVTYPREQTAGFVINQAFHLDGLSPQAEETKTNIQAHR
jgi:hypothetical protein